MLVEWLFTFVTDVLLEFLDAFLPDVTNVVPSLDGVLSGVATLNAFLPVTETIGAAGFVFTVTGVMFLLKITQTLVAHIPFIGGGGA